ncbi:MAG TPA: magnesium-translocating P-type ATPase [Candidatus Saccharimonadales bacterium]|nr:magnesium-translocating P-type ATPase [Candidatus Saccharimonadales bacterium]
MTQTSVQHIAFLENQGKNFGLTKIEALARLRKYGPNIIVDKKRYSALKAFFAKFTNPLVLILLVASFLSIFTRDIAEFVIIFAIVLFSVCVDFFQEYRSEKAVESLQKRVVVKASVYRDGHIEEVPISHVTVGDIVILAIGDVVPADVTVLFAKDLHIDQSVITGESFPAQKEEKQTAMMGTTVLNGEGVARVEKIGKETEFGKIADTLSLVKEETDFEKGLKDFGVLIAKLTVVLALVLFGVNAVLKHNIYDSLLFSLALAVGLTPELLPAIVTVNLSRGALRMVKKGVIVKHLPAIQNFGSMNVLCTDKTGTITQNKIILERYENSDGEEDKNVLRLAYVNSFFQSNVKNPLDEAILAHKEGHEKGFIKIDEIPFDFMRKRLSIVAAKEKETILISKGAADSMWEVIKHVDENGNAKPLTAGVLKKLQTRLSELESDGYRVLTVAHKNVEKKKTYEAADEKDLIFIGFTAFMDPPKHEVKVVLQALENAGVTLKILTGDSELVTKKICTDLSIPIDGIMVEKDLINLSDEKLRERVKETTIFARLTPQTKARVVQALRSAGFSVGYMGDGVNDAPSIKAADVGISVENAVDIAKSEADIILVTKSLKVLQDGIIEGRKTFANTMKYIYMGTGSNFGNMFSVSIASIFLPFLPMLPIQILLNNLIYDVSQLAIPTDNVDSEEIEKPQHWDMSNLKKFIFTFGPISSVFDLATFAILLSIFNASIAFFRTGWFIESVITQSLIIFAIRTKKVPFLKSKPSVLLTLFALTAAFSSALITQTTLGSIFQFVKVPPLFWMYIVGIVIVYFVIVELTKLWFYKTNVKSSLPTQPR